MLSIQVIVLVSLFSDNKIDLFLDITEIDMDCDGLKKNLLIDTDGTLVGQPSSIFSQADYDWG
jgi:hypothetical protein